MNTMFGFPVAWLTVIWLSIPKSCRIFWGTNTSSGVPTSTIFPFILECEVKWALESITTNKVCGGNGILAELFQILKDDAVKVPKQYARKFEKLSSGHRAGKGQF